MTVDGVKVYSDLDEFRAFAQKFNDPQVLEPKTPLEKLARKILSENDHDLQSHLHEYRAQFTQFFEDSNEKKRYIAVICDFFIKRQPLSWTITLRDSPVNTQGNSVQIFEPLARLCSSTLHSAYSSIYADNKQHGYELSVTESTILSLLKEYIEKGKIDKHSLIYHVFEIYSLADFLGIDSLAAKVIKKLKSQFRKCEVDLKQLFVLWGFAELYQCHDLKKLTVKVLTENFSPLPADLGPIPKEAVEAYSKNKFWFDKCKHGVELRVDDGLVDISLIDRHFLITEVTRFLPRTDPTYDISLLAPQLANLKCVRELTWNLCADNDLIPLFSALGHMRSLQRIRIYFENRELSTGEFKLFALSISSLNKLKKLALEKLKLTEERCGALASAMRSSFNLRELELNGCPLDYAGFELLFTEIAATQKDSLVSISLRNCGITLDIAQRLIYHLAKFPNLTYLNIMENKLNDTTFMPIAKDVSQLKSLRVLEIDFNPLGPDSSQMLASELYKLPSFERVTFVGTKLESEHIGEFIKSLRRNIEYQYYLEDD